MFQEISQMIQVKNKNKKPLYNHLYIYSTNNLLHSRHNTKYELLEQGPILVTKPRK